jgi:hypothetical protein
MAAMKSTQMISWGDTGRNTPSAAAGVEIQTSKGSGNGLAVGACIIEAKQCNANATIFLLSRT